MTHTYAILEISPDAYQEIREALAQAGYHHAFHQEEGRDLIDMHGIAVAVPKSEIPPHQQRVIFEKKALDAKLTKLNAFLSTPTFEALTLQERNCLVSQASLMELYRGVLAERIAGFTPPPPPAPCAAPPPGP